MIESDYNKRIRRYREERLMDLFPGLYQRLLEKTASEAPDVTETYTELMAIQNALDEVQVHLTRMHSDDGVRRIIHARKEIDECITYYNRTEIPLYCKVCGAHIFDITVARLNAVNAFDAERIDTEMCHACFQKEREREQVELCETFIDSMLYGASYAGCVVDPNGKCDGSVRLIFTRTDIGTHEVQSIAVTMYPYYEEDGGIGLDFLHRCIQDITIRDWHR